MTYELRAYAVAEPQWEGCSRRWKHRMRRHVERSSDSTPRCQTCKARTKTDPALTILSPACAADLR